ncbi:MAG: outer membrane protein assembly factor BamA [Melioribacteraceae bacterium]|nr:MAG: outer membrane protein assembly factor BamA [Melioribacteraceae bacterium]
MLKNLPNKWLNLGFLILILFSADFYAQVNRANYQILGISVEGSKSADANTIIANTGLKIGNEISVPGDETINAIKRLWNLGIFEDVQIVVDKKIDNGVFLVIKVKEYPRVQDVIFEGNDEISTDDLKKEVNVISGQTLKQQEIHRVTQKFKSMYEDEGYLNAEIFPLRYTFFRADTLDDEIEVTWRNENDLSDEYQTEYEYSPSSRYNLIERIKERVLLKFVIDEGDEVIVRKIEFVGNEAFDDDDLKSEFDETAESKWWKFWSSAALNKKEYEKDKELLKKFYNKNGYIDFEVLGDTMIFSDDKKDVELLISINEGNQYKVRNINWSGNTIYEDEILSQRLGFDKGDIYDTERLSQNLHFNEKQTDVSSLYQDEGYLGFNISAKEEKVSEDSLDLNIRINEGKRFKIGKVSIAGNSKTKDKVIRRELYSIPGDYFSRNSLFRSIQQLANLNYFNVEQLYTKGVNPRPMTDSTVAIDFTVEEKSSDYLNASVGYSGSFGFSGAIGVTLTNFSIAEPFQMGGGQILDFSWQFGVGNFYRTFKLGFTEPWFNDTPTLLGFEVFDTRQRYVYDLRQSGGTLRVGRRLTWPDNYFSVQGLLRFQYNNIIDGANFYEEGLSRQYTLGATIARQNIDNPIFPSNGSNISLNAELSGGPFLPGNVDYLKLNFKTEWYKRLFNSNRITIYTGSEIGYIDEIVSGTTIQPFEFFWMGGNGLIYATTPLRGYDDRSLGPKSDDGDVVGSRVLLKHSIELRAALALDPIPIYVLAFAEAGNVFLDLKRTDFFDLKRSVGLGARLLIQPVGLIGFDYGYGFDRKTVDGQEPQWIFHFQFGKGF